MRRASVTVLPAPPSGRMLAVGILASLLCLGALSARLAHLAGPVGIDAGVSTHLVDRMSPTLLLVLTRALDYAVPTAGTLLAVAIAACCRRAGDNPGALFVLASPALSVVLTEAVLKPAVGRHEGDVFGFPSGLATGVSALSAVCLVVLSGPRAGLRLSGRARSWLAVLDLCSCGAVVVAMVVLRYHYFTDVLGGFLLAGPVVALSLWVLGPRPGTRVTSRPAGRR